MGTINLASPLPGSQLIQRLRETIRPLDAKPLSATPVRPRLKVLAVASEIYPLVKTGGLADVTGALPKALSAFRIDTHSLVPGYPPLLGSKILQQADLLFRLWNRNAQNRPTSDHTSE